ncbi:MAG: hypothetical protein E5X86_19855 [Mesorhizobium sp.]|uniref:hypothetical protein n=1 Tax=Mesorhizobium sp. TaxID=1871066 RepID=UPI001219D157|nr:hypothetical protein [Mesorhizobium sp.]TIO15626.1 MAG: hypothetical protein E5X86_19855 [Mesorhizobium sp.]
MAGVHGTESRFQDMTLKVDSLVLNEVAVTATAAELNAVAGSGVSAAEMAVLDGATAGVVVASKAVIAGTLKEIDGFRDARTTKIEWQGAAEALNATGTVTTTSLLAGIITSTTAAAVTATLPVGGVLDTALSALPSGVGTNYSFAFSVVNTGANGFTLATATGWTDGGNGFTAVAAGTSAMFRVRRTGVSTYTLFRIA